MAERAVSVSGQTFAPVVLHEIAATLAKLQNPLLSKTTDCDAALQCHVKGRMAHAVASTFGRCFTTGGSKVTLL